MGTFSPTIFFFGTNNLRGSESSPNVTNLNQYRRGGGLRTVSLSQLLSVSLLTGARQEASQRFYLFIS